jgi:transposase InsO family protein
MRLATTVNVAKTLERHIFCRFGIPNSIHSDRGSQFTSHFFKELGTILQIRCTTTPAYNPKSNPVERSHRDLGDVIRATIMNSPSKWEEVLPQAVFALNTSGPGPALPAPPLIKLSLGKKPATLFEALFGHPPTNSLFDRTYAQYLLSLQNRMAQGHEYIRQNVDTAMVRRRRAYHLQGHNFCPGQAVWLYTPAFSNGVRSKLQKFWTGPWTVIKAISPVSTYPCPATLEYPGERSRRQY